MSYYGTSCCRHQDLFTSANYISLCAKRAFAFYMDLSSVIFLIIIVGRFLFFDVDTAAGDVGLAITQAAGLAMIVQFALMQWSETESNMTSVERALEYTYLRQETKEGIKLEDWPKKGEINYVNVSLTYRSTNEKVLKNISFAVKSKQKIGIVGRTGAGKSSIISTLFRLYNYEGQIFVDDVEIKTLSLEFLRQHISIIPQDPIMFQGTIRKRTSILYSNTPMKRYGKLSIK
uniref:Putative multidrug resistance-associated protein lethal(2)03659 n=1 Tax=Anoplophora glabripennis TaxID=217634 RepID=V5GTQ3_ANOGL